MESSPIILQKIKKECVSPTEVATKYYSLLSVLNNLSLTPREIQLLAFTAVKGSISSGMTREMFAKSVGSTKAFVNNMVHKLSGDGFIIKNGRKLSVHPKLTLDFTSPLVLMVSLNPVHEHKG